MPTERQLFHPAALADNWSRNTVWQGCTFAVACGDEVPEGECHSFCLECVYYSGFQPCCVDSRPLCRFGRMMSPTAIALRMMDRVGILQRYSSGQPRVQRFPLQLTRAPTPRPDVPTPPTAPQAILTPQQPQPIPIPQQAIADVCNTVVKNPQTFQDEPQPMTSDAKAHLPMQPHTHHQPTDHLSRLAQMSSTDYLTSAVRNSMFPVARTECDGSRSPSRSRGARSSPYQSYLNQLTAMTSRHDDVPPLRDASPSRAPAAVELKASVPPLSRLQPAMTSSTLLPLPPPLVSLPQNAVSMTQPPTLVASTPASASSAHQMTSSYDAQARIAAWRKDVPTSAAPRNSPLPQSRQAANDVIDVDSDTSDDVDLNRPEPEAVVVDEVLTETKNAMYVKVATKLILR